MTERYEFNIEIVDRWLKRNGKGAREKLAVAADLSGGFVDRLRRTKKIPTGTKLIRLSKVLNVPMEALVITKTLKSA